jgi:hypothetical protein
MFDPTIFENLKVVVEGELYDRDLAGEIIITEREDQVNLSTMSRSYTISFQINNSNNYFASIVLVADPQDLYGEILEMNNGGCNLLLLINGPVIDPTKTPSLLNEKLVQIWHNRPRIEQQIYYDWNPIEKNDYYMKITLNFDRKINEDHISDFPEIINLLQASLEIIMDINS